MNGKPLALAGSVSLVLLLLLATAAQAAPFSIEADSLEFSRDGRHVLAAGAVVMTSGDMLLKADAVEYDEGIATASGRVSFSARDTLVEASWLQVNLDTRALAARDLRGKLGEYFIRAAELAPGQAGEEDLRGAALTRCDLDLPCYELQAGRIAIDGTKVTIERGWLALRGRRILPFPRITLDTERMDAWPSLRAGYDERGLYLGAAFTMPLAEQTSLIVDGELATEDKYSLRATLDWRTAGTGVFRPWLEYSHTERWQAGFDAAAPLGSWRVAAAAEYGWEDERTEATLILAAPSAGLFGGQSRFEGFLTRRAEENAAEEDRGGLALVWSGREASGLRARIRLSLGRVWRSEASDTFVRLETEIEKRLSEDWGFKLNLDYDGADRAWEEGEIGLIRHLHCYYLDFDYDWVDKAFGISAGINF